MSLLPSIIILTIFCIPTFGQFTVIPKPAEIKANEQTLTKSLKIINSQKDASLGDNAYKICITQQGVKLSAGDSQGMKYAKTTLEQLQGQLSQSPKGIPTGIIMDKPTYPWRGMMIDVARHYMPLIDLKKFVDIMSYYKFNVLHIHLTDNHGWRLPVPGYPKLGTIASKRAQTFGNGRPHEGIYTKKELKELVAYCQDKGIEVIPEIDVPGHNQALACAYPEFFCSPDPQLKVKEDAGMTKDLLCPQKPAMWKFYKAVFKELKDIFPAKIVHLGGDEAPTDKWQICPECQKARSDKGQKNCHEEMAAFFIDMTKLLKEFGKEPQFWYENNANIYEKGTTVFAWYTGKTRACIKATKEKGLKLILTPGEHCYLDYPQMKGDRNYGWMPTVTLKQSYQLDPTWGLSNEEVKHIIGVHCTLWAERFPTLKHMLYRAYPRAIAIAEVGWTPKQQRNWDDFQKRLEAQKMIFEKKFGYSLHREVGQEPDVNDY